MISRRFASLTSIALVLMLAGSGCGNSEPQDNAAGPEASEIAPEPEAAAVATPPSVPAPAEGSVPAPVAAPEKPAADYEWLLVPGERAGKITGATTLAGLVAAYGADNVRDDEFHVGEGEMIPCSVLFPDDDRKRVQILWSDPGQKDHVISISIVDPGTVWKTTDGLTIGTPLSAVETLNGKPFKLFGFGWDYGGRVSDFNGGALGQPEGALQVEFQLDYDSPTPPSEELTNQVTGDAEFPSDNRAMRALNPTVYSLVVSVEGGGA